MSRYNVIGLMSGTSLDGLDICSVSFEFSGSWNFAIKSAETIAYPEELAGRLKNAINLTGLDLSLLNNELGNFMGSAVLDFISKYDIPKTEIDLIGSHGHTVFHQIEKSITVQIGNGANISAKTKLPVVCDFRTVDVALGGNGAPLVPIGDQLLFGQYDCCINLGGIANVSYDNNDERIAYDICPVNMVLNNLTSRVDLAYDKDGELAKSGQVIPELLEQLNGLSYYTEKAPKSLGYEWVEANIIPLLDGEVNDLLRTVVEHAAMQIGEVATGETLFTGGGTFNSYLVERIQHYANGNVVIPSEEIISFKEALIFAFLAVLRVRNESNALKSATGASRNNVGGCIYNPLGNS